MHLLGVIAEYNPFHYGHAYLLTQAKIKSHCDAVIAIMSGHFTQRGEAAIYDKWQRTAMALHNGADLVLELPTAYAVRSAYDFALGGVLSLAAAGIQTLAFGCAHPHLADLERLAQTLVTEPLPYRALINKYLQQGLAYPKAQQLAMDEWLPELSPLLKEANNLLAIHYLQILKRYHLPIEPLAIKRQIAQHGEQKAAENSIFASSTAIRQLLYDNSPNWRNYVPPSVAQIITNSPKPVALDAFSQTILTLIRRSKATDLQAFPDVSEGLEHRLWQAAQKSCDISTLCASVKSKRYTYTRLQRILCAILLGLTKQKLQSAAQPAYLRVLGFNDTGRQALKYMKSHAALPIITKTASAQSLLNTDGQNLFNLDCQATDIYHLAYKDTRLSQGRQDFYKSPIIISHA